MDEGRRVQVLGQGRNEEVHRKGREAKGKGGNGMRVGVDVKEQRGGRGRNREVSSSDFKRPTPFLSLAAKRGENSSGLQIKPAFTRSILDPKNESTEIQECRDQARDVGRRLSLFFSLNKSPKEPKVICREKD